MSKGNRLKRMKHSPKIRVRSTEEILAVMGAYRNIYKDDPHKANLMLLLSEISEYTPVPTPDNDDEFAEFLKKNGAALTKMFVKRFKSIDEYAIPRNPLESLGVRC
jgi:hypothetical protein